MNTRSLRFRITVWYAGLLALSLLLFGSSVYLGLKRHLDRQLRRSLAEQAKTIGENLLADGEERGDRYVIVEINESYAPEISGRFIRVVRADYSVLYESSAPRDGSFNPRLIPAVGESTWRSYEVRELQIGGRTLVTHGLLYTSPRGKQYLIETGAPDQPIREVLHSLLLVLALGMPAFVIVAVAGGRLLVKRALGPVQAITQQAERISSHNIAERLPVARTGDEIERLSISLNRMIARLEEAFEQISRFTADVSHELRTPLTILRGELEIIVQQGELSPEVLEQIGNALEEIERLSRIVDQLLVITRLDAGQAVIEHARLDLGSLTQSTVQQMQLLAEEKALSIRCKIDGAVEVYGDPTRLRQVVVNLMDNAIKYTSGAGCVEVSVFREGEKAVIGVADNGAGIDAEALTHVFERFFRSDKARNRESGGTGLGLAIVKAICTAHQGTVTVKSIPRKGTSVRVELPLASNQSVKAEGAREPDSGRAVRAALGWRG